MTNWLGMPALASTHGGQIDSMISRVPRVHVHPVRRAGDCSSPTACSASGGRAIRWSATYTGAKSHTSSYPKVGVALVEAVLLFGFAIPLWAAGVDRMPAESDALVVQVTAEQFAWNIHYAGPDKIFGRRDIKLIDAQENPLGIDRSDPAAKDDVTTRQSALSAGEQADHREAQKQGRHPQLRRAGVPREAGRRARPDDPDLVRPQRHDRRDADPDGESRVPVPRSPARSSAAWATPGCGDSSPS